MVVALEPRRAWQRTTLRGPFSSSPAHYLERLQKLPLGRDSCCQGREQRGHSQSECAVRGMGVPAMSPSPPATSLAEDLPWHCPPPVPTPTSSPCLSPDPKAPPSLRPPETQALSKLSFPEQSPCFPNLPGKGERAQLLPVSSWLVTAHNCPLCFLWLGRDWNMAKPGTQTSLICMCGTWKVGEDKKPRPEKPTDL